MPKTLNVPNQVSQSSAAGVLRFVFNNDAGNGNQMKTLQLEAQTNVNVFAVHKIPRIKTAESIEDPGREQHKCSINPMSRVRF